MVQVRPPVSYPDPAEDTGVWNCVSQFVHTGGNEKGRDTAFQIEHMLLLGFRHERVQVGSVTHIW